MKVTIITPYKLTDSEITTISQKFPFVVPGQFENIIDPGIIGGFIIKKGTSIIDASVKGVINSLKDKLYEND